MAFHSEIKINYQVLQDIASSLKQYESELQSMQQSIANMDRIISENEGETFVALGKVKRDFDDDIRKCKEEIRDIYTSIDSYVSEMCGIIGASPAGSTLLVDRADIYCNLVSIKNTCADLGRVGQEGYGYTVNTAYYEDDPDRLAEMQRDVRRTSSMKEAIQSAARKIDGYGQAVEKIYETKIVKYEDKDDEHRAKINTLHRKYRDLKELLREGANLYDEYYRGIFNWLKDLAVGVVDLLVLSRSIEVYFFYKIIRHDPPDWSKQRVEGLMGLKNLTPWNIVEALCQSGSDTVAEEGYAYGIGYIAPDVAIAVVTAGSGKAATSADDIARAANLADNIDDMSDVARTADKLDDISDAARTADKVDDISDCSRGSKISEGKFKSSYDIPIDENGHTRSSLELGKKVHKEYRLNEADDINRFKETPFPSGKRPDFYDIEKKVIYELKPNNPKQIAKGRKQLAEYIKEAEREFGGKWTGVLDTY